jgi:hypothetical protein
MASTTSDAVEATAPLGVPVRSSARRPLKSLEERFWKKVNKNGPTMPGMQTACWVWTGTHGRRGYGSIGVWMMGDRHRMSMHAAQRVSWWLSKNVWPGAFFVCHHCDNPECVRPEHLFLGNAKGNHTDMARKGRRASQAGENNPFHRLTEQDVAEIMGSKEPTKALVKRFGVCGSQVRDIKSCRRGTWRSAPWSVSQLAGASWRAVLGR